jgi:hypothetical protein
MKLTLKIPIPHLVYRSELTGRIYVFHPGDVVEVDERDAPRLLAKTRTEGCCGSPVRTVNVLEEVL